MSSILSLNNRKAFSKVLYNPRVFTTAPSKTSQYLFTPSLGARLGSSSSYGTPPPPADGSTSTFSAKSAPKSTPIRYAWNSGLGPKDAGSSSGRGASNSSLTKARGKHALSRPPPQPQPEPVTFSEPSKPRPYYARPGQKDLPPVARQWPTLLGFTALGLTAWALFYLYATNQEKLASSVVQQIMTTLKEDDQIREVLGEAVRMEPKWWMNGDSWVEGGINMMQGHVDVSFRVKGHKGAGTLYFTSLRKAKGEPFTILRFKVIADDGRVVHVETGR